LEAVDPYIIIFAVLAVVPCLCLYSVLGQRAGSERPFRISAFTYRLSMIAFVLFAVNYVAYEAKWYAAIAARVTPISSAARPFDGDIVTIMGILVAMAVLLGAALVLSFLHWKEWKGHAKPGDVHHQRRRISVFGVLVPITAVVLGALYFDVGSAKWYQSTTTAAATIGGPARVIDGDTVVVAGTRVRLKGVDAAELGTERGENARRVMAMLVTGSLTCRLTGEKTYNREVGYCSTTAGVDINQAIIAQGAALACPRYDARYLPFEQAAALAAQQRASYCVRR
jgi:endonuclease YncB( thermonuclease family)